jgi:hypothetical protein
MASGSGMASVWMDAKLGLMPTLPLTPACVWFLPACCGSALSCREWAVSVASEDLELPGDVPSCFEVLARHFEPSRLRKREKEELQQLWDVIQPFDFTSDVSNLLTRFQPGSRSWLFEKFEEWLALSKDDLGHRAVVLYGGPGLGKSTVVAALVAKKADGGSASAMVGHWFCRHNDSK